MINAEKVISFLNPINITSNILDFDTLKKKGKEIPPHTFLSKDFFEKCKDYFPLIKPVLNEGEWIQIGVGKGGGALFLKALMKDLLINQKLYLIDTFGTIPISDINQTKDLEFIKQLGLSEQGLSKNNFLVDVKKLIKSFNLFDNIIVIEQDVNYFPTSKRPDKIALLHIDVDFYEATLSSLEMFYENVIPGGIIIIDDYFMELLNCKEAVDHFFEKRGVKLEKHSVMFSIFSLLIVKPK